MLALPQSMRKRFLCVLLLALSISCVPQLTNHCRAEGWASTSFSFPAYCNALHTIGKLGLLFNNGGRWGPWDNDTVRAYGTLCSFRGRPSLGIEYPNEHRISAGGGGIWIGAVIGHDSLVSVATDPDNSLNGEFFPDRSPFGEIVRRSTLDSLSWIGAISELDYVAQYTDTFICCVGGLQPDYFNSRSHRPLQVAITQRSYSWSNAFCDDFVLLNYNIINMGEQPLDEVYVGFEFNPMVGYAYDASRPYPGQDDIMGFRETFEIEGTCVFPETLNIVWAADNDGDPIGSGFPYLEFSRAAPNVVGIRLLGDIDPDKTVSFNWWTENISTQNLDFGPNHRATPYQPAHFFGTGGNGVPRGDRNKFYLLANGEIDYDVLRTSEIGYTDPYWDAPTAKAVDLLTDGDWVDGLYSVGPFRIDPGESIDIPLAIIGGDRFHTKAENAVNLQPGRIDQFMANVDFADLVQNAINAEWVYDNPGYDSDSDGYAGKYRVCELDSLFRDGNWVITRAETTWYRGDGVPDWRALTPPIPPTFWLEPTLNGIRIRFNGAASETRVDPFTQVLDFEGYNVYVGRDDREASLALAASFDREDYDKWVWDANVGLTGDWVNGEQPFTLEKLRCLYGSGLTPCLDSLFHPLSFGRINPYRKDGFDDSIFYFTSHESNASGLGVTSLIRRVYPDEPLPPPADIPASAFTVDGYLKYYEYECLLENLLPTVPYFINVTAFDFGFPEQSMAPLESNKLLNMKSAFAAGDANQSDSVLPPVYVYPNPYRADAEYRKQGFEGRLSHERGCIDDRVRRIHFVNLPPRCMIRIHTLDGDLVREIAHNVDPSDPNSTHDSWDLINRNIMTVESGLYYWSVEGYDGRVQIGQVCIIR